MSNRNFRDFIAVAEQQGLQYVDLAHYSIDPAIAQLLDKQTADRHQAIPIARGDGTIKVAMAEPDNVIALDDLKMRLQVPVEAMLADPEGVTDAINRAYEGLGGGASAFHLYEDTGSAGACGTQLRACPFQRLTDGGRDLLRELFA